MASGNFQKYDYGKDKNLIYYGQSHPPVYATENIKVPIFIHYGGEDILNHERDVEEGVVRYLPTVVEMNKISKYGHIDFLVAEDVIELVYEKMLISLNKYNNMV